MATLDYNKTRLDDRLDILDEVLTNANYEDHFDNNFKVNLNSSDALSDQDSVCQELEKMANYLLNSDEEKMLKKDEDFEYKFYNDEDTFQAAINKEPKLDGMGQSEDKDNVIHFLKNENRNFKKTKAQVINMKDMNRQDELGNILRAYNDLLQKISKDLKKQDYTKVSRYILTRNSGSIKQDMLQTKDMLLGTFGYRTNASESTVIDWDQASFTNAEVVEAMLYFDRFYKGNEEIEYLVEDFYKMISYIDFNPLQVKIISLVREELSVVDIAKALGITRKTYYYNKKKIIEKIIDEADLHV